MFVIFHIKSVSIKETFESFQALFAAVPTDFRQLLVPVKGQKICGIVHYSRRLNGSVASDVVGAHILLGLSPSEPQTVRRMFFCITILLWRVGGGNGLN